jgi:hypothetical protein
MLYEPSAQPAKGNSAGMYVGLFRGTDTVIRAARAVGCCSMLRFAVRSMHKHQSRWNGISHLRSRDQIPIRRAKVANHVL